MTTRAERARSFGSIADEYNRLRPPPAPGAVNWLVPPGAEVIIDLAAGTGLLTRALAQRVAKVIAVEPDQRMAAVLLACSPGIEVVAGVGESIPLQSASADGLFISSAFHWMDPELAVPEIARVLKDGGQFGMIWTARDRMTSWVQEMDAFSDVAGNPQEPGRPRRRNQEVKLPEGSPFGEPEITSFTYERTMALDDVVAMVATYSRVITATQQDRDAVLGWLRSELTSRFPGAARIDVPIRSLAWRAGRLPRPR
ncbi:MAG TPA: class I SAM-dependent methyltransferase [Streptosporangiaceae bacterium]|nr:class I SAM-dependent methyltransferase [Streptosporangiaceae bacterium]